MVGWGMRTAFSAAMAIVGLGVAAVAVVGHGSCARPREHVWLAWAQDWPPERLPLTVAILDDELRDDYAESTIEAVAHINTRVGCRILKYIRPNSLPDIMIQGATTLDDVIADASIRMTFGRPYGVIRIERPLNIFTEMLVITHELGHVLGLAHDPGSESSVMHPNVVNHAGRFPMPRLSDEDARALRHKYCYLGKVLTI